ncbi:MAG: hypothetical protein Q8L27_00055 [archaeon]|nr:hypothetical protein [archaeon]
MQINFLKKVVENTAGIEAVRIVDLLYGKKDINEFLIAKKLALTINQTRNLLYRLSHLGILTSIRKKDKRKGWYIYFWTFNIMKSLEVLEQTLDDEINLLKKQLDDKHMKRYYRCKHCGREVNEEGALITNFICGECGEVYDLADNTAALEEVRKKVDKLTRDLNSIKGEIKEEQEKQDKSLLRKIKKDKVKKSIERKLKMKKRLSLLKKTNTKKAPKKKSKKGKL